MSRLRGHLDRNHTIYATIIPSTRSFVKEVVGADSAAAQAYIASTVIATFHRIVIDRGFEIQPIIRINYFSWQFCPANSFSGHIRRILMFTLNTLRLGGFGRQSHFPGMNKC
ncbi:hypothetical protein CQ10_42015 [Bradyrhizobium valentinum]|nr:hypothetical protein CQ10_42015 [Bradyrhizobium valentinum]